MKTIRNCVFETNSSSCHSLIMCDKEVYQKIGNGEWFISVDNGSILDKKGIKEDTHCLKLSDEEFEKCYDAFLQYFNYVTSSDLISPSSYIRGPEKILEFLSFTENADINKYKESLNKYFDLPDNLKDSFIYFTDYTDLEGYYSKYEDFESFEDSFISKSGDEIIAFGYYGTDN